MSKKDGIVSRLDGQDKDTLISTTRKLLAELQSLSTRINAINEIATAINGALELDEILTIIQHQAKWLFDFDHCSVYLIKPVSSTPYRTLYGTSPPASIDEEIESSPIGKAISTRQSQLVKDVDKMPPSLPYRSFIVIPLESERQVFGTIQFGSNQENLYNFEDLRIGYLLALQLSGAIRNAVRFKEMTELYQKIEQAYADLRESEKLREELTAMIVHDLRNPITVINSNSYLLKHVITKPDKLDKAQQLIRRSETATQQMMSLIDDMLDVGKFEAGELTAVFESLNLTSLLEEVGEQYSSQAESDGICFQIKIPQQPIHVRADAALVRRVVENFVTNAFKFSDRDDAIVIELFSQPDSVLVTVHDNGPGIPQNEQATIFDKFSQVKDDRGKSLKKGTGLGLAFCKMAIEQQHGTVGVISQEGQGSTFYFSLLRDFSVQV